LYLTDRFILGLFRFTSAIPPLSFYWFGMIESIDKSAYLRKFQACEARGLSLKTIGTTPVHKQSRAIRELKLWELFSNIDTAPEIENNFVVAKDSIPLCFQH